MSQGRLLLIALLVAPSMAMGQPNDPHGLVNSPDIELPSITSTWEKPGDKGRPEITIEDLERCMGDDVALQREVNQLKPRQAALKAERDELEKANQELSHENEVLQAKGVDLSAHAQDLEKQSDYLRKQEEEIKAKTASPAKTKAEWKSNQVLIDAYNANVSQFRNKRSSLLSEQETLNQSVSAHNMAVDQLNKRGDAYNASNDALMAQASALMDRSQSQLANCAGERTLRAPSNP
jgi:chromosome segregation ATPase